MAAGGRATTRALPHATRENCGRSALPVRLSALSGKGAPVYCEEYERNVSDVKRASVDESVAVCTVDAVFLDILVAPLICTDS
eukprot:1835826-Prymnesium_polylepis.1